MRGSTSWRAEVRRHLARGDPSHERVETAAAKCDRPRPVPDLAVEQDGYAELVSGPLGDFERGSACLRKVLARERDERDDIGRADPRVHALVAAQIDEVAGGCDTGDEGVDEARRLRHEHVDRTVVVLVRMDGQKTRGRPERLADLGNGRGVAPLGHVRHRREHDPYPTAR